tara:strand:+ start:2224 stop:2646 length:423 start_codon:yes stop_codon:yes gene_type:complete
MYKPNDKSSEPNIDMTTLVISPTLYSPDLSAGLSTVSVKKRKRRISFFDGENYDKPRPAVTAVYDRDTGVMLSVKTFDQKREEEDREFAEWMAVKRRKRDAEKAKAAAEKAAKTEDEDMKDAVNELSYNPMDMDVLLGNK